MDATSSRKGTPRCSEYSRGTDRSTGTRGTLETGRLFMGYSNRHSLRSQWVLEYRLLGSIHKYPNAGRRDRLGPVLEGYSSMGYSGVFTHPNAGRRDRLGPLQGPLRAREADRRSGAAARARSGTPEYPRVPRVLPSTPSARRAPGTFSSIRRKRPSLKADRPVSRTTRQLALPRRCRVCFNAVATRPFLPYI